MTRRRSLALALVVLSACAAFPSVAGAARRSRVLLVGTYKHKHGKYKSIQAAVDAAKPGDWILVAPGDWHEQADHRAKRGPQPDETPAGVVIATPHLHLRGMNRNTTIVDGTLPGRGAPCSSDKARQDFGPAGSDKQPLGRNGVLVWKADDVSIDNLTVCNFLGGNGSAGNEIWWNGGDGSGKIGLGKYEGSYLNATSTFYDAGASDPEHTAAQYGIFSSNDGGPGVWDHTYASNFNDSNYYIGACQQACNQTLENSWSEYSALGYSGTNAGGQLVIKNNEFDNNKDGFDTNSQNNDDSPSPQDGACPKNATSPITHTHSCWVFMDNYVHDNNNPNVPGAGAAAAGPVGTGMSISGGRDNTVMHNRFENNGAWGIILVPYPDTETPPQGQNCQGGQAGPDNACLYDDWGNEVENNTFKHNGFFGNDSNGDIAEITSTAAPTNCYHGNTEDGGGEPTTSPSGLQQSKPKCDGSTAAPDGNPSFLNQVVCDSQFFAGLLPSGGSTPCVAGTYPQKTKVVMPPLPTKRLATMPNPCKGVPANPWCPAKKKRR